MSEPVASIQTKIIAASAERECVIVSDARLVPVRPDAEINAAFHSWIKREEKLARWILFLESQLRGSGPWFVCPVCGGGHFGTQDIKASPVIRCCHDEFGVGCKWRGEYKFDAIDKSSQEPG